MIGKLTGILDTKEDHTIILDVQGVGYLIGCSAHSLSHLPDCGEKAMLWIETHVREDHIHLYGFTSLLEKEWFHLLMKVTGVGTRMALAILSSLSPMECARAIITQDKASLLQANGVGPKLATRILTELKDHAAHYHGNASLEERTSSSVSSSNTKNTLSSMDDAIEALVHLGYKQAEAQRIIQKIYTVKGELPSSEFIREGLKLLRS